jgi:hypothetical protein
MNAFVRHHLPSIPFRYSCFDRLILNGYVNKLQMPGSVIWFLRDHRRLGPLSRQVFSGIAADYHDWVTDFAATEGIDIVQPPRDARREDLVGPYFDKRRGRPGLAVILKAREPERLAVHYARSGAVALTRRWVQLYYFYLQDPDAGRLFVRVCPYFPFNISVWMNGHDWLAGRLRNEGIGFRQRDNSFTACDNPERLQELSDGFGAQDIRDVVEPWLTRLVPFFTDEERRRGFRHQLYMGQVEYCHNLVFHQRACLDRLFGRLMDLNREIGHPKKLAVIFGRGRFHPDTRTGETQLKVTPLRTPVISVGFKGTFIKQYAKEGALLRTETTSYQLKDLSVNKGIDNLGRAREVLSQNNERYLEAQQDVLETYVDRGQLQQLRQPSVSPTGRRTPGLRLDDPRLLAVLQALVSFVHLVGKGCFRTAALLADVRQALAQSEYGLAQLRYDLGKLRAKGLVKRLSGSQEYQLTAEGYRLGVLYLKLYQRLYGPLTAGILEPFAGDVKLLQHHRCRADQLYEAVDKALQKLTTHFGIKDPKGEEVRV